MHGHYWNGSSWRPLNSVSEEYSSEYVESLRGTPFDDPAGLRDIVKSCEMETKSDVGLDRPQLSVVESANKVILAPRDGSSPVILEFDVDETGRSTAVAPTKTTRECAVESVTVGAPKVDGESPFAAALKRAVDKDREKKALNKDLFVEEKSR